LASLAVDGGDDETVVTSPRSTSTESAILVPVPEAEPVVGPLWGVPAHVTVFFPFAAPDAISGAVIEMAAAAVASVRAFECEFASICWFGDDVVWLAPEPAGPFRALTNMVHAAFPQFPPFGGVYADVVPHLTIGNGPDGGSAALRAAEAEVTPALPVRTQVRHAWLMTGTQALASWRVMAELPLGTWPTRGRSGRRSASPEGWTGTYTVLAAVASRRTSGRIF
jgi:2'-5' RNA ligase